MSSRGGGGGVWGWERRLECSREIFPPNTDTETRFFCRDTAGDVMG